MSPLTNFQKWQAYTSVLPSPQIYVDWAYYYMIGACLQRRVWLGPTNQPLFPNMFVILVGEPGIGKGLVIREVSDFMRHWKLFDVVKDTSTGRSEADRLAIEAAQKEQFKDATAKEMQGKDNKEMIPPYLFCQAADSTTYQALIEAIGEATRSINYYDGQGKLQVYRHASISFQLQELSSLMREKTQDIVNFLLGLYDCPVDYDYRTVTRKSDRIRRACVNFLAGTTPAYMQNTFDSKITDEGLSSRTFYICATKNRKNVIRISGHTPEQLQYKQDILNHIKLLSKLYGPAKVEEDTWKKLEAWWDHYESNRVLRANKSPKLKAYYARKQIHTMKLAMARHYGEIPDLSVPIPWECFEWAQEFTEHGEKFMHLALTLDGNTPQSRGTKLVIDMLATGKKTFIDLYIELFKILGHKNSVEELIGFLEETGQIERCPEPDPKNNEKQILYYKL